LCFVSAVVSPYAVPHWASMVLFRKNIWTSLKKGGEKRRVCLFVCWDVGTKDWFACVIQCCKRP
jgi:hypothetical protein